MGFNKHIAQKKSLAFANDIHKVYPLQPSIKKAFATIDREPFVPLGFKQFAYKLDALPIAGSQWISSPLTVAKMTNALSPFDAHDSVLEIGCGSGYQAAILSQIYRRVFTVERIEKLYTPTRALFKTLDLTNINLKLDDGNKGWKSYAPYDRILFSASIKKIPAEIFEQLREGGTLVAPMDVGGKQVITRFTKGKTITQEVIETCKFVPVLKGIERG